MDRWLSDDPPWLGANDAVGDQVSDLKTSENRLSVFEVPPADPSTPLRIAAALTAARERLDDVEYCLFDDATLSRIAVRTKAAPGRTPDPLVNSWHKDLVELSGNLLTNLAMELRLIEKGRVLREDLQKELLAAIREGTRFSGRGEPNIAKYFRKKGLL